MIKNNSRAVINIRYHTNTGALKVIAFPSTPVKPQSNTALCNCINDFFMLATNVLFVDLKSYYF